MDSDDDRGRVSRIFLEARDLDPSARRSFLDEACNGDDGLRHEVESLLAHDDTTLVAASNVDPTPVVPGYRVVQKIGEGGMGEVWLARQEAPVQRDVAIKVIKAGMDTKHVVARFEAERQALALMEHPSIARVFAAGETSRGLPFFVMEYVRGEAITAYADRHKLGVPERLALFVEVCEAVQHAHQKGVVHRDLKPSNVLVAVHGRRPFPKIIDFGVAKATAQRLTERSLFTEIGTLIGTPEYMSPEQAELTGLDVDARTDVYSLGVILYELLVGALPFDSRDLRAAGFDEIRRRIREDEPRTPSERLRGLGPVSAETAQNRRTEAPALHRQLRGDLDWITMRALEKDRTRRYQSASELAAEIERHQRSEPILAGPPSARYKLSKFVRRNRAGVAAALAVTAAAVALLTAAAVWPSRERATSRSEPIQRQLTSNPPETAVHTAAISPDGKTLAFADPTGTYLRVIQSGETRRIVAPETLDVTGIGWFPDGTRLAMTAICPNQPAVSAWTISANGGAPRKVRDLAIAGPISPDGSRFLFFNLELNAPNWFQNGLWVMGPDGEGARMLLPMIQGDDYQSVAWSPDGTKILFVRVTYSDDGTQAVLAVSDLSAAPPKVLLSDPQLFSTSCSSNAGWLPDGRIVFTRHEPPPNQTAANFWELRIDPKTYTPSGRPTRLTHFADSCITNMDAPPDGSHLTFLKQRRQSDVFLGELRDNGDRLENVRRLTLDDRDDFASSWTRDGRSMYITSNRQGTFDILKQGVGDPAPEAVVQGPGRERRAQVSPDGLFLLYQVDPPVPESAPARIVRTPLAGGTPELVLEHTDIAMFLCPRLPAAACVAQKAHDRELSFFHLDPAKGMGKKIGRFETSVANWNPSPDGSRIAVIGDGMGGGTAPNGILSMNVSDGAISDLHIKGLGHPEDLAWSSDGNSLFITDFLTDALSPRRRVVHADLAGHVHVLWESRIVWSHFFNPLPSPDGRYLSFGHDTFESNAWALENF